jgi:hypothetical protein
MFSCKKKGGFKMKKITGKLIVLSIVVFLCVSAANASNGSSKILKEGLLGAATGAIASEASGGKAGKGALIGAGVNVVGGALLDSLSGEKVGEVREVREMSSTNAFEQGYQKGYEQGLQEGYTQGYNSGFTRGYEAGSKVISK